MNYQNFLQKCHIFAIFIITTSFFTDSFALENKITALEGRLRPYLETKIKHRHSSRYYPLPHPNQNIQTNIFALPRVWNNLSAEFKQLYHDALNLPSSFQAFESPGGFFEIYFTSDTNNYHCVDKTDNYGYSNQNWKLKIDTPNGVPDYIDEVGWALDSTYNAEIIGFDFKEPIPYKDNAHKSDKYKILVENFTGKTEYGIIYPFPEQQAQNGGFATYFTIRNNWSSHEWEQFGYNKKPELGIRVTCAHEFFHAIQYALCRQLGNSVIDLDDFPLSWIEGSATAMEELVFSDINDYIQYANMFFYNTDKAFLERDNNFSTTFDYTNSLLIIYLYYYASTSPGIDFIRQVFYNNHSISMPFYSNIEQTSNATGFPWPELLNKFHTASFFSGSRADSTKFIPDGNLLSEWSYTYTNSLNVTLTVNPYAMEKVFIRQRDFQCDTLIIHTNSSNVKQQYAASVILRKENADTLFPIPIASSGKGSVILANWNDCTETGIIVTNGNHDQKTDINVSFEYGEISYIAGDSIEKKQLSSDSQSFAKMHVKASSDLRGNLTITENSTYLLMQQASAQSLSQQSALFTINYPEFWNEKSNIQLTLGTLAQRSLSIPDSTHLYAFYQSDLSWHIVETNLFIQNDTIFTEPVTCPESATYCIFSKSIPTEFKLVIYPNPFSLRKNKNSIIFDGTDIKEIVIYDLNGNLVKKIIPDALQFQTNKTNIVKWDLKNRRGKTIIPGLYIAAVWYYDNSGIKNLRQKILVVP